MRITKLSGIVALCAGSIALVGCGGSSSSTTTTQPAVAAHHPSQTAGASNLDTGTGAGQRAKSRARSGASSGSGGLAAGTRTDIRRHAASQGRVPRPAVSRGNPVQKGRSTEALSGDDHNPVNANGPNPCRLVSLGEAKTITGGAISASSEAPLGPTCVYKATGSKSDITVNVESTSVSKATGHMSRRQQVTVHGHHGYCGTLGTSMLYVPLGGGQVLHITAPCAIAQQFAALALGRLAA